MPVTLDIDSRMAEKLRQLAKVQHLSVEQLLAAHVPGLVPEAQNEIGFVGMKRAIDFDAWVSSFPADGVPLPDEAVSRSSIYGGQ